jgi:hypothetical protein
MLRMVFVGVCWVGFAASAMAEVVEFVVDPTLTRWGVRGVYFRDGQPQGDFEAQFPGSDTTPLTGILRVDLTPTTIQFLPGSVLDAVPQPLPQQPGLNGGSGVAPADFGVASPTLPPPVPVFAVRNFGFSLTSPVLPLNGPHFQEDLEAVVNARVDYDLGTAMGSHSFTNWQRGFDDDHGGNITSDGLVQTIRLQNYLGDIVALQRPADSFIEWSGPIVATRIIPEPGGILLAIIAIGFGLRGRRCAAPAQ